jgi:hypothetical protein
MVLNATFNNISAILWRSVLLVEETRVNEAIHQPAILQQQVTDKLYHIIEILLKVALSTITLTHSIFENES